MCRGPGSPLEYLRLVAIVKPWDRTRGFPSAVLILGIIGAPSIAADWATANDSVKLNQIQLIGTHNSYHAGLSPGEARLLLDKNPTLYQSLEYRHAPLDQQLNAGVRQIELDIFADTQGGRYAHPAGPRWVAAAGLPPDPVFDPDELMSKPGFKVMHVQDLDYRSTCQTLIACLTVVRTWSAAHPRHLPVFILLETKQADLPEKYHATVTEKFTPSIFDALDAEIRSVFGARDMIVPDQIRGRHRNLQEAVLQGGWPKLAAARGKVMFLMDQRPVGPMYLQGHASLAGRVIFTNAEAGQPDCALPEENDGSKEHIAALVRKGYWVRTRTDADTKEARRNDATHRDTAFASGAQFLSTDYPASEPSQWSSYSVSFANGAVARCNPVNGPHTCSDSDFVRSRAED
jgi:hypothetical protein